MFSVGQRCEGLVTSIATDVQVDVGASVPGSVQGALWPTALRREAVDLGCQVQLWVCGVDLSRQRLALAPLEPPEACCEAQRRFRRYLLRPRKASELLKRGAYSVQRARSSG